MAFRFDPRRDLPPSAIQPTSYYSRPDSLVPHYEPRRGSTYGAPPSFPKKKPCYDWIFSSASNYHVAVDRSSFKTYVSFKSYALAVADQRQVPVKGIGSVELKIRRQPGSRESHKIELENVLHVPSWLCNIISDTYFLPANDYEHTWTQFGVNFQKSEDGAFRAWGFTENFCGLDKIVLSRSLHGRSPMLEDKDREVFSINLTWPQSQKDRWDTLIAEEMKKEAELHEATVKRTIAKKAAKMEREMKSGLTDVSGAEKGAGCHVFELKKEARSGLTEISGKVSLMKRGPSVRASSLKARTSGRSTFRESLPWRKSTEK